MKTLVGGSRRMAVAIILALLMSSAGCAGGTQGKVLTHDLSEPLNGATTAKVDINCGPGHLTIAPLSSGEQVLANGRLQYLEGQGLPTRTVNTASGQATLTLKGNSSVGSGFRWPWEACGGGAFEWHIRLNPKVTSDITAHSDGGNVLLDLTGMAITHVSADTGGGNMDVVLPDNAANSSVTAKSGAGNVVVHVPSGVAARVHATTGLGKLIVDARFNKIDGDTYQSSDYDSAANKAEITVSSGAGDVTVDSK